MTHLLEKDFDTLTLVTHYTLVKVTGKNKLFIVDPSDKDSAYIIDGYIAELYSLIDGTRSINEFIQELMTTKALDNTEAKKIVKNAILELLSMGLIELSGKNEKEKVKKNRS